MKTRTKLGIKVLSRRSAHSLNTAWPEWSQYRGKLIRSVVRDDRGCPSSGLAQHLACGAGPRIPGHARRSVR